MKNKRFSSRKTFISFVLVLAVLCSIMSVANVQAAQKAKLALSKKSSVLQAGKKETLKIKTRNIKKVIYQKWKSSNTKIATVSKKGVVKAKKKEVPKSGVR